MTEGVSCCALVSIIEMNGLVTVTHNHAPTRLIGYSPVHARVADQGRVHNNNTIVLLLSHDIGWCRRAALSSTRL